MRRFWPLLSVPLLLLGAGCSIEQTPNEYIDRIETPEQEVQAAHEELTDRLLSTGPSLQRNNLGDVASALTPHPDLAGVGPDAELLLGGGALTRALGELTAGRDVGITVLVQVSPSNDVAWFRAVYELAESDIEPTRVPFSGVFVRQEGEWRLHQAHLSAPVSPPSADPVEEPDSAQQEAE